MQYQGGKSRQSKVFAPPLVESLKRGKALWVEPFVGGFNLLPRVSEHVAWAVCSDIHPGLIKMYRCLQNGWIPPEVVTEEDYYILKEKRDWDNPTSAFAAFGCSFGGKEWGGYARSSGTDYYSRRARSSLLKKAPHMVGVEFRCLPYNQLEIPEGATIYCDPPYANTTEYRTERFDTGGFLKWAKEASSTSEVFVSEYVIPDGWEVAACVALQVPLNTKDRSARASEYLARVR